MKTPVTMEYARANRLLDTFIPLPINRETLRLDPQEFKLYSYLLYKTYREPKTLPCQYLQKVLGITRKTIKNKLDLLHAKGLVKLDSHGQIQAFIVLETKDEIAHSMSKSIPPNEQNDSLLNTNIHNSSSSYRQNKGVNNANNSERRLTLYILSEISITGFFELSLLVFSFILLYNL